MYARSNLLSNIRNKIRQRRVVSLDGIRGLGCKAGTLYCDVYKALNRKDLDTNKTGFWSKSHKGATLLVAGIMAYSKIISIATYIRL